MPFQVQILSFLFPDPLPRVTCDPPKKKWRDGSISSVYTLKSRETCSSLSPLILPPLPIIPIRKKMKIGKKGKKSPLIECTVVEKETTAMTRLVDTEEASANRDKEQEKPRKSAGTFTAAFFHQRASPRVPGPLFSRPGWGMIVFERNTRKIIARRLVTDRVPYAPGIVNGLVAAEMLKKKKASFPGAANPSPPVLDMTQHTIPSFLIIHPLMFCRASGGSCYSDRGLTWSGSVGERISLQHQLRATSFESEVIIISKSGTI